ncbi:hypothetical protein GNE08_14585 [Trichormus variabilis ARAD]|uniref:Uncharacterized protein n=1 Tax=Trichormus variabilis N2B TaxID=2681315 RepID=A0ABR6S7H3_ANAVA|nr:MULTISPECIES: hypothetical protein [Nostocaceae]MBC1256483.1 hypothetical protein [Trichormus variabilis V5]MBC1215446.1 hypothetical protein [Trichormus variabilis ARAD]MBC1267927.1 hypothetical protein [Trichormus variabilis FSR]MBC1302359.1 hypothetical protein [Trichormus variabilis N2B]MBC1326865.1 hypothetical protein [Trichormus variabilis 9RC]
MNSDSESLQQYLLGLLASIVNKHENSRESCQGIDGDNAIQLATSQMR